MRGPYIEREEAPKTSARTIAGEDCMDTPTTDFVRAAEGYDPVTQLWCARMPTLTIPDQPSRKEAEAALRLLRETFRTFPFADALPRKDKGLGVEVVDLAQSPGLDESTFLVGLLTA